jgi:hypothetical protein
MPPSPFAIFIVGTFLVALAIAWALNPTNARRANRLWIPPADSGNRPAPTAPTAATAKTASSQRLPWLR